MRLDLCLVVRSPTYVHVCITKYDRFVCVCVCVYLCVFDSIIDALLACIDICLNLKSQTRNRKYLTLSHVRMCIRFHHSCIMCVCFSVVMSWWISLLVCDWIYLHGRAMHLGGCTVKYTCPCGIQASIYGCMYHNIHVLGDSCIYACMCI